MVVLSVNQNNGASERNRRYSAMWSKMDSDLVDITRKSNLKWNTPLSGCYKAPSDFRLQSVGDFSSNGNIPIVPMLNYDVMLERLTSTVKRGFPGMFSLVSLK
jgi:hypothetical protein